MTCAGASLAFRHAVWKLGQSIHGRLITSEMGLPRLVSQESRKRV